jgi:hypothetical protein
VLEIYWEIEKDMDVLTSRPDTGWSVSIAEDDEERPDSSTSTSEAWLATDVHGPTKLKNNVLEAARAAC